MAVEGGTKKIVGSYFPPSFFMVFAPLCIFKTIDCKECQCGHVREAGHSSLWWSELAACMLCAGGDCVCVRQLEAKRVYVWT